MNADMIASLEDVFVDKYFILGDDKEIVEKNNNTVSLLITEFGERCNIIAEQLEDGLSIDVSEAVLSMQILHFALQFQKIFSEQLKEIC